MNALHRPRRSLGKDIKLYEMKNEKNYAGFLIHKIGQILKRFSRAYVERKPLISEECLVIYSAIGNVCTYVVCQMLDLVSGATGWLLGPTYISFQYFYILNYRKEMVN